MGPILTFEQLNQPHAVYRLYDRTGALLYVGCSSDPTGRRWERHLATKLWFDQVARITCDWFDNWSPAILAEGVAIFEEQPLHNHHVGWTSADHTSLMPSLPRER
jgi:diadenosine tetraphosphatase ApaH/serine/threonine PP2A family protein phosphatase